MARTTAPLFSMSASGTLNDSIVFSNWKGRSYVRSHVIPHNPKSAAQTGIRAMMKFLSQQWAGLSTANQATWATLADAKKVSAFNAFVSYNLARWREFKGPSIEYPAAETVSAGTVTLGAPAGGPRNIVLTLTPSTATNMVGIVIFRDSATIVTANWNIAIAIAAVSSTDPITYTDSPLDAGTYHYRAALLTDDGNIGTACADQSGTAT